MKFNIKCNITKQKKKRKKQNINNKSGRKEFHLSYSIDMFVHIAFFSINFRHSSTKFLCSYRCTHIHTSIPSTSQSACLPVQTFAQPHLLIPTSNHLHSRATPPRRKRVYEIPLLLPYNPAIGRFYSKSTH